MNYKGSCHCGAIAFEVEGELKEVANCNCSICLRKGSLHWFVPRSTLHLLTPEENMADYTFGTATIKHHFCPKCGIHPFAEGVLDGHAIAAINARCLEGVDLSSLPVKNLDGKSL